MLNVKLHLQNEVVGCNGEEGMALRKKRRKNLWLFCEGCLRMKMCGGIVYLILPFLFLLILIFKFFFKILMELADCITSLLD